MTLIEAYNGPKNMVIGLREEELCDELLQRIDIGRIKVEVDRQNQLKKLQKNIDMENETNKKNAEMMQIYAYDDETVGALSDKLLKNAP